MSDFLEDLSEFFKALSDPTRLKLVRLLMFNDEDKLKVIDLAEKIGKYTVEATSPWDEEQENYARTYYNVYPLVVGGKAVLINKPTNKPELLSPYIGLTILLAVAVATVVYVKKSKNQ